MQDASNPCTSDRHDSLRAVPRSTLGPALSEPAVRSVRPCSLASRDATFHCLFQLCNSVWPSASQPLGGDVDVMCFTLCLSSRIRPTGVPPPRVLDSSPPLMPVVSQLQTGEDAPALKLDPNITLQLDPNVTLELESDVTADEKEDEVLPDDNIFFPDECPLDPSSPSLEPDEGFVPPKAVSPPLPRPPKGHPHDERAEVPPCDRRHQHRVSRPAVRVGEERLAAQDHRRRLEVRPVEDTHRRRRRRFCLRRRSQLPVRGGAVVSTCTSDAYADPFGRQTFNVGATKKTIAALAHNEKPGPQTTARFPLWTRSCDAGVVTVFVDGKEVPVIERDRLPAGSVGVFKGEGQEMEVYDHHGRKVNDGMPVLLL